VPVTDQIKNGDVVRLKSSRRSFGLRYYRIGDIRRLVVGAEPKMTVERVSETGAVVDCVWFDGAEKQQDRFFSHSIERV